MSLKDTYSSAWEALPATIASGASMTGAINLGGLRLFGLVMPESWTAANVTFQASMDGGATWVNLYDQNGNEVVAIAGASRCIFLSPSQFSFLQYLRLRSGTASSPVAQTNGASLQLILRGI